MSDISKCDGAWRAELPGGGWTIETCPLREGCHRYTVPVKMLFQSWIQAKYDQTTGRCWNYVEVQG
jgi:hypothetical protein